MRVGSKAHNEGLLVEFLQGRRRNWVHDNLFHPKMWEKVNARVDAVHARLKPLENQSQRGRKARSINNFAKEKHDLRSNSTAGNKGLVGYPVVSDNEGSQCFSFSITRRRCFWR